MQRKKLVNKLCVRAVSLNTTTTDTEWLSGKEMVNIYGLLN